MMNFFPLSLIFMLMSSIICLFSSSWILAWLLLEINTMSFVSMMNYSEKGFLKTEAGMKYFLIQTMAASLMFFFYLLNFNCIKSLIMLALMIKLAAAPLHFWYIQMAEMINWKLIMLLMTWQKLAPLILILSLINKKMMLLALISILWGSLGQYSMKSLRKLMAFSSISHLGWILISMFLSFMILVMYCLIYTIIFLLISNIFSKEKSLIISEDIKTKKSIDMMILMASFMGMPPLMGFFPKWMVTWQILKMKMFLFLMVLILSSILNAYIYIKMFFKTLFMKKQTKKNQSVKINWTESSLMKIINSPLIIFIFWF